ncbi:MAG TPA: PAS domain S-box protein [Abditibacterium sp.]
MSFSPLVRHLLPLLLCFSLPILALGLRVVLATFVGEMPPFLLFFAPIIFVAWRGGQGYGLLITFWSGVLSALTYVTANSATERETWLQLAVFLIEGVFVSILTARYRTAQDQLARRTQRQTALAQISGLALTHNDDLELLFSRTSEICAQSLAARAAIYPDFSAQPWLQSLAPSGHSQIGDLSGQSLSDEARREIGDANALLSAPFTDGEKTGVLLVLSEKTRVWSEREREFLGAVADILSVAARQKRERVLRRSNEARYRAFVEQSSEAIWCFEFSPPLDLDQSEDQIIADAFERGYLSECNDVFAQMYGFEGARDMIGTRLGAIMKRDEPRNMEYFQAFLRSNYRLTEVDSVEIDREGKTREFVNNLVGILENGQILRAWGTQRDVSEQKEASSRLRASEERFRALFDTAPIAIAITRDGILLYVNRASVELLGCQNAEQMIGHPVNEFVAPPDRETMQKRIERRAAGFDEPLIYEANSLRRDGTMRPFRIEIAPLDLPDGPATLAFAFDLTREKADQAERAAHLERERRTTRRAVCLQEITSALAGALSSDAVARIITSQGVAALEGDSGALSMPGSDANGDCLRLIAAVGYPADVLEQYATLPLDPSLPVVCSLVENRAIWLGSREEAIGANEIFAKILPRTGTKAVCCLPLEVEGKVLGVFSISFHTPQNFDPELRAFMLTLASQCAQALDRVRLFNEAQLAARMQQESLALLDILLDSAPIGFSFFDLQARHVMVNRALSQMSGISVEDHLGRTLREIAPGPGDLLDETIRRVLSTREPSGEIQIVVPDEADPRRTRHCLCSFYPVFTGGSELLGVGAVVLDVTARMQSERERVQLLGELEMERARFEAILQQMPSAVILGEAPHGRLILGNAQVGEVLRQPFIPSAAIEDYGVYSGFHADGRELELDEWPLTRAIKNGEIVRGEEIIVGRGDGSMGVIRLNAAPIRDRDGHITAGVVVFDDVTQRARADNAQRFLAEAGSALVFSLDELEVSHQLANFCVPRIADFCLVATPGEDGRLTQVVVADADSQNSGVQSDLARRLETQFATNSTFPWDISGVMQQQKATLFCNEYTPEMLQNKGLSAQFAELITEIGVRCAVVAPLGARGRVLGVMVWITAQSGRCYDEIDLELADELALRAALTADNARLYNESQTARDEAQTANRAKDEFLAVVSHELRTPLTPILGWLELLRSPNADAAMRAQGYGIIERNARAQAQLINDILDVSRITTGKLRLELKPLALAPIIDGVLESLRPLAAEKQILIKSSLFPVGEVLADSNRIQQVTWNLLQNALKFTHAGGEISVELVEEQDLAVLRVSDNGSGIESEFLPHVFDRFRQADSSSTRRAGGLGLGLAIVSHIVAGHEGRVEVQSEGKNKGATFLVEIPLIKAQLAPIDTEKKISTSVPDISRHDKTGALQDIHILITDDEPDTREMMQILLTTHGAHAETAASARQTLEILTQNTFDLLLCDIGMPEMDGYQLRQELSNRNWSGPSVALTAYTAPSDVQRALEAGFDAHLPKPVEAKVLLELILRLTQKQ